MGEMVDKPQSSPERTPAVTQVRSFLEGCQCHSKRRTSVIKQATTGCTLRPPSWKPTFWLLLNSTKDFIKKTFKYSANVFAQGIFLHPLAHIDILWWSLSHGWESPSSPFHDHKQTPAELQPLSALNPGVWLLLAFFYSKSSVTQPA